MTQIAYLICRLIFKVFFSFLYNLKVYGAENIPKDGSFIVAANHSSFYDPVIIISAVRQKIFWVMAKDLYNLPILNNIFKFAGFVGVNGASNEALEILGKGKVLGIFPEGGRSRDGLLKEARSGVALLALKSGAPVIPCAIKGAYEVYSAHRIFPRLGKIRVIFGKPLFFDRVSIDPVPDDLLSSATKSIMHSVEHLLAV